MRGKRSPNNGAALARSRLLDQVWMIVLPDDKGVIYDTIATSARGSWQKVFEKEILGTGITRPILLRNGYRAKKVEIALVTPIKN